MVTGIQFTHSAQQRTIATQLAYDMIDRMRSNQADWSMTGGNADAGVNYNMPSTDPNAVGSPYLNARPACVGYTAAVPMRLIARGDFASATAVLDHVDRVISASGLPVERAHAILLALARTEILLRTGSADQTSLSKPRRPPCRALRPLLTARVYFAPSMAKRPRAIRLP
jgi:hypothetical protein